MININFKLTSDGGGGGDGGGGDLPAATVGADMEAKERHTGEK